MYVGKVGFVSQNHSKSVNFGEKSSNSEFENPISRSTEKNLSVLSSIAGATTVGVIAGGLSTFLFNGKKLPIGIAAGAGLLTLALTLPSKVYNANVNAYVREKEMDVFSRDRDLKTNLTEQVGDEVKNSEVSLDKKLDDNLKLQMANRGAALGIANVTPKA